MTNTINKFFTIEKNGANLNKGMIKDMLMDCLNMPNSEIAECLQGNYQYSILNLLLCKWQLKQQGYNMGLIQCGSKWREDNRTQKQGAKKLWMRLPVTIYERDSKGNILLDEKGNKKISYIRFKFAQNWLAYDQTQGDDDKSVNDRLSSININLDKICSALKVKLIDYDYSAQNCGGYAIVNDKKIAINPAIKSDYEIASVLFHELGHVACEHKATDNRAEKEIEAEGVALIMGKIFNIGNEKTASAYIQNWSGKNSKLITDKVANNILKGVNKILKANNKGE